MEAFSGTPEENVVRWIRRFELHADAQGWEDNKVLSQLQLHLRGTAEIWLQGLTGPDDRQGFQGGFDGGLRTGGAIAFDLQPEPAAPTRAQ